MSTHEHNWKAVNRGALIQVGGALATVAAKSIGLVLRAIVGGPAYGIFVIAYNLIELATYLILGGFIDSMVLFTARWIPGSQAAAGLSDDEREERLYRSLATGIGVPVVLGVAGALLTQWLAPWLHRVVWSEHDPLIVTLVQRLAWAVPLLVLMQLPAEAIKAHLKWGWSVTIVQVLFPAMSVIFSIASALLLHRGILSLVDGVMAAFLVCVPASLFAFSRHFRLDRLLRYLLTGRWDREVFRFALPQGMNMALNQGLVRVDTLVLSAFVSANAVGVYALVTELTQLVRLGKMSISGVYSPLAARLHASGDRAGLLDALHRMAGMTSWLAMPLLLAIMSLYPALVLHDAEVWEWPAAYPWLLCVGPLMSCFFGLAGNTLLMVGRPGLLLVNSSVSLAVSVSLSLALVPSFGVLGAAIGTAASNFAISSLQIVEVAALENLRFKASLYVRTVAAAVVPLAVVVIWGEPTGRLLRSTLPQLAALPGRIVLATCAIVLFVAIYRVLPGQSALSRWRGLASRQPT